MPCQIKRSTGARRYNAPSRLPLRAPLLPGGCPYCPDHPTHVVTEATNQTAFRGRKCEAKW